MLQGDLADFSLAEALRLLEVMNVTGSLRVVGDGASGTLYSDNGMLVFGTVDGAEIADIAGEAGIDPELTRDQPTVDELRNAGVARVRIDEFAWLQVKEAVRLLSSNTRGRFAVTSVTSPFGSSTPFPVSKAIELVLSDKRRSFPDGSLLSLRSSDGVVELPAHVWNALVELIRPFEYRDAVAVLGPSLGGRFTGYLEGRGLLTRLGGVECDQGPTDDGSALETQDTSGFLASWFASPRMDASDEVGPSEELDDGDDSEVDEIVAAADMEQIAPSEATDPAEADEASNPESPTAGVGRDAYQMIAGLRASQGEEDVRSSTLSKFMAVVRQI